MKVMVVGANGQLGSELLKKGDATDFEIIPLDLPLFDITKCSQVKSIVRKTGASMVINASAHTAVDRAEFEEELAVDINRDGPEYLACACKEAGIPLIHVSTDYVFDGAKMGAYSENDPVCPLGVYGKTKAAGEKKVRENLDRHIILRTAWLYGVDGQNFVKTMLRLGKEKSQINVVSDQVGCPTYAADLANAILEIAAQIRNGIADCWGTYHYCGKGETSWHGFAEKIFELAGRRIPVKVMKVMPVTTGEYPTPAKRPARSVLDCSLINKKFGICARPWQESLEHMLDCLFDDENNTL